MNLGLFQVQHSVGAVDLARDTYFSGTAASSKVTTAAAPSGERGVQLGPAATRAPWDC